MTFGTRFEARLPFEKLLAIARKPYDGVRGQLAIRRVRKVIREEFTRGGSFRPAGGFDGWQPTQAFGTRPATVPPLGGGDSALLGAYLGGPGGSSSTGPNSATITVSLPYARIQREGGQIGITDKMRGKVGAAFGVHFSRSKTFVTIPRRPHVDMSAPPYVEAAGSVVVNAVAEAVA